MHMEESIKQLKTNIINTRFNLSNAFQSLTSAENHVDEIKHSSIRLKQSESEIQVLKRLLHEKMRETENAKLDVSTLKRQLEISNSTNRLLAARIQELSEQTECIRNIVSSEK